MIQVKSTPNHAGAIVSGDAQELETLREALERVIGEEGEHPASESVRVRAAAFVSALGHASASGDSESKEGVKVLWPEFLFLSVSLNGFIKQLYKKNKEPGWELTLAKVRKFQESIIDGLRRFLPDTAYQQTASSLGAHVFLEAGYMTQFLDGLNAEFLEMNADQRLAGIPVMARRIALQSEDYRKTKNSILEAAKLYKYPVEEIRLREEVPNPYQVV
ncbi:hypothetical protein COLU111180_20680 [Cohnella lubricantis]|uniref:Uncharacterized protein n=1 Tax=Cohnella lubricantis TaxID=2163172 RepID=A0A841TKL3_9BACL|nr:hypothetical protein [Cohnella lubricantis]MBB6679051.1 hypothetical protein [Cohnella lubricantis]MBP2117138.1 hypothetical protein [Cohnella lubricantis]